MRWIYISPHLDDAVLSAGGFIFEQIKKGNQVELWTIMCGYPPPGELTPFAQYLHDQWGTGTPIETVDYRRKEDVAAAQIVDAKTIHFDIPDCIYRRGQDGEPLYQYIFVPPHETESDLPDQIAHILTPRLQIDDQVICQLGIGGHVDHVLVRKSAEKLTQRLWYTADVPYVFKNPEQLAPFIDTMKESLYPISEAGLRAWIEAVLAHKSQLSELFDSTEEMKEQIRSYYAERSGFPMWRAE